jgi:tetratricopeptide (TPR) repeat protein
MKTTRRLLLGAAWLAEIRRELGNDTNESVTLGRLGQVCADQGDVEAARQYFHEAHQLNRLNGDRWSEGYTLNYLGNLAFDSGRYDQARDYYEESLAIRRQLGPSHLICEPLAGLAQLSLASSDLVQAQVYIEEIWPLLQRPSSAGLTDLLRVYLVCIQVFQAAQDDRHHELLKTAYALLQKRAERISNESHRQAYLLNLPTHQALHQLYAAL